MALPKSQNRWSKEDVLMLLECMENNLPSNDNHMSQTTQSHLDWGQIAFKNFSGEMCKLKWLEISRKLNKSYTLKELVLEAKKHVKNPNRRKQGKKHPDFPKKPLTAYIRFFKEQRSQYTQMYPGLRNQELTKILSKKYRELPEQMKQKYIQAFQKEKQEFEEKLARFREDHPDLVQNSKKSNVSKRPRGRIKAQKNFQGNIKEARSLPKTETFSQKVKFYGEPEKPPMNGYHKFHQDSWSSRELQHLSLRERMVEIGRRWQRVPQNLKEQYKSQAEELQKQYKVDLDLWLKTLSPEEYAAYREATCAKRKNMPVTRGPNPKFRRAGLQCSSAQSLQESLGKEQGLQAPGTDSAETVWVDYHPSEGSKGNKEEDEEEDGGSNTSDSSIRIEDEDD
ncbi:upstream-binding factor 1-like protein 1 [Eulemur rufifrons]|uniref:upstream-binding factor 1-like protein 1 n=1 Tax=Eulemur rufifrons TaxID=859984 RepID=UPI003743FF25